jgi:hypothetical protein
MLSRIHVYAASLGLLLAGPAVAVGQSSTAVMPDRASAAAAALPSYEAMGFPITPHQFSVVGSANVEEQSPSPSLTMAGMPASHGHAFWVVQALMCLNQKVAQGINSRAGALRDRHEGRCGRS